jgi:ribonuclease HI
MCTVQTAQCHPTSQSSDHRVPDLCDHPRPSVTGLRLLPWSSSLPTMPHLPPGHHEISKHDSPHDTKIKVKLPKYPEFEFKPRQVNDSSQSNQGTNHSVSHNKYSPKSELKICRYASWSYKLKTVNNTNREILAIIHAINFFWLYLGFKEFTVRTDCEALCKYYNQINSKKSSTRRWVLFKDIITENGYKVIFDYIKGKDNKLPDLFSHSSMLQVWRG